MSTTAETLLTVREAAARLRCSYHKTLRLIHAGKLQAKWMGKEARLRVEWVDAYVGPKPKTAPGAR